MTSEEKEGIVKEIENAQMLKELEVLIRNLNDDQLDRLEGILTEDEEEEDTEFGRVKQELLDMGIDAQDIEDLKTLAALMSEFLMKIPNIKKKLEMRTDNDLLDNVQVNMFIFHLQKVQCNTMQFVSVISSWFAKQTRSPRIYFSPSCLRWRRRAGRWRDS